MIGPTKGQNISNLAKHKPLGPKKKKINRLFLFLRFFLLGLSFVEFNDGFVGEPMYGFGSMSRTSELVSLQC